MRTTILSLALVAICAANSASAGSSTNSDSKREAQLLAAQAIDLLNKGEDAPTDDARRALYREGLQLAERAVALDEQNPDAHFAVFGNRGRMLLLDGVGANPISLLSVNRDLERALELNPNHADALTAKGGLYRQLPWVLGGSLSVAEECLTKAIALDPQAVSARIELAATYRAMGHPRERSVELLRTAASIAAREGKQRKLDQARSLMREIERPDAKDAAGDR
jgi:tetratricopeptide (TPR) repeat protein